jgi:WD40 repeat protein
MHSTGSKISLDQDLIKNQISPTAVVKRAHGNSIESLAIHPNHKTFATGSHDRTIKLWDAATLKETATFADHKYSTPNAGRECGR